MQRTAAKSAASGISIEANLWKRCQITVKLTQLPGFSREKTDGIRPAGRDGLPKLENGRTKKAWSTRPEGC
jgi:hypothetical protein